MLILPCPLRYQHDSGQELHKFSSGYMYKKIRKKKSVQCFADFFIAVVGHEILFFDVWFLLNQDLHKHTVHRIRLSHSRCLLYNVYVIICTVHVGKEGQPFFYALRFFAPPFKRTRPYWIYLPFLSVFFLCMAGKCFAYIS